MSLNNNNSTVKKPTQPSGTTDSPYLGSKISLVSKAKIRYEGILYTIDANESTVALSKVRSFGTEGRPTDRPVPARDEIFEYIIFRGADIEDLQVREPPQSALTQDPAIVESSMYPASARSGTAPTSSNTNASNLGGNQTRLSGNQGAFSSPSPSSAQQGPNKGTKPPSTIDPLRQLNFNQQQSSRSFDNQRRFRQQDYPNESNNRRGNNQKYDNYTEWPRTNNNNNHSGWENNYRQQNQRYPRQQQQQQQNYEGNRFYPSRRTNNNNNNNQQSNGYYGYRQRRNSTGGIGGNRQQRDRADSTRGNNSTSQSALKFIGDFDFEKSNAEFDKNAIEDELKKSLSIKTSKDPNGPASTNEQENNEQQEEEQQQNIKAEPQQPPQEPGQEGNHPEEFYDKQKSFFDRISCETTEKEKTNNSRRNWNEERRINAETFGLKYRPNQQGGNPRNSQNGGGYYNNNNRRYNSGQQSYYGNNDARYQRGGGGGGGNQQQQQQQRGRNNNYYGNSNRRMQAY